MQHMEIRPYHRESSQLSSHKSTQTDAFLFFAAQSCTATQRNTTIWPASLPDCASFFFLLSLTLKSAVSTNRRRDLFKCLSSCRGKKVLRALTKVEELLHGQRRGTELGEPLHFFRDAENGAVFHQKLGELHFGPLALFSDRQ